MRLILCQNSHSINSGVRTIGQCKINNSIFSSKGYRRFCNSFRQILQSTSLTSSQYHSNDSFLFHTLAPLFFLISIFDILKIKPNFRQYLPQHVALDNSTNSQYSCKFSFFQNNSLQILCHCCLKYIHTCLPKELLFYISLDSFLKN